MENNLFRLNDPFAVHIREPFGTPSEYSLLGPSVDEVDGSRPKKPKKERGAEYLRPGTSEKRRLKKAALCYVKTINGHTARITSFTADDPDFPIEGYIKNEPYSWTHDGKMFNIELDSEYDLDPAELKAKINIK